MKSREWKRRNAQKPHGQQPALFRPVLPPGYEQIGEETWPLDHRWMTYASYGREVGVLVYADGMALSFYAMEEATTLLYVLFAYGDALIEECDPAYLHAPEHAAGMQMLRSL